MKDKGIILAGKSFSYKMFYWLAIFIIYFLNPSPLYSQFINTENNKFDNVVDTIEFSQDKVSVFLDSSTYDNSYDYEYYEYNVNELSPGIENRQWLDKIVF